MTKKKPLEQAMEAKKAKQTKDVKKLMTSDKAYSPKKLVVEAFRRNTSGGGTGTAKLITDWENISEAKKQVRKRLPGSSVTVRPQNEKRRTYAGGGRALRGYGKAYMKGGRVK